MSYKSLMAAAASAAILIAAPAYAQGKGGGGGNAGGPPAGTGASAGANVQGSVNASPTGIGHANENSVLSTQPTTTTTRPSTTRVPDTKTTTDTDVDTDTNVSTKSKALQNSQGPANASPTGIAHANSNSVLARRAVQSSTLPGLKTGLVVNNSTGTQVGTVTKVITGPNNTIRAVVVTTTDGKTVTLAPSTLTISGSVVTTTSTSIGG